jgi:NADPH:quinone reductase-like Zn-dependent oxidoreductase
MKWFLLRNKKDEKMKAAIIKKFGELSEIVYTTIEKPIPADGQILVKVKASGLNPVDAKLREGHLQGIIDIAFPRVLGGDVSGVIEGLGVGVTSFNLDDEVFFSTRLDENGGNAEYVTVDASIAALKPKNISHDEAATLPVVALTAIQALRDYSNIKPGDNVLIHAGAGGVGTFAIQYAKHIGATVYTTASTKNAEKLKALGADYVIDYKTEDFVETARKIGGFDIVFETVGGENYRKSLLAAKTNAVVPAIVNPPEPEEVALAKEKGIKTDFMLLVGKHDDLKLIAKLVDEKTVKTTVGKTFILEDAKKAHELLVSGVNHGKIVILNNL